MSVLKYKGYIGKVDYSVEDECLYGIVDGMNDFVDFSSENAKDIVEEFHKAVDGYIEFCKEVGKEPEKSYSGSFNIRINPETHRKAVAESAILGITLNQFVANAIEQQLAKA